MAILTVNVIPEGSEISLLAPGFVQEGNFIAVNPNTKVSIIITKPGYKTVKESVVVVDDITLNYELELEEYTITFDVYPTGAIGSTTINGVTQEGYIRKAYYNDILTYSFEKDGYESRQGSFNVTGNETKRIVLLLNRTYNNPNQDVLKEHRNLAEMYPAQFSDKKRINDYIKAVENPFFEKPDEMAVIGYIGNRNQDTDEKAQFIDEPTADRKINQLVPVALTESKLGDEVLTFKNFVAAVKEAGNPTENQNKFLHSKQWSWCPIVNIDMLINYSLYHWIGYDRTTLPWMKFKSKTNVVRDAIGKKSYTYAGLVDLYSGEIMKQEYESSVTLYDGMRIMLSDDSNPEYNNIIYMVSGVGGSIKLTEDELYQPHYAGDVDSNAQDYYVIEKGSADANDWSLANRWVHRRVLELMAPDTINDYPMAERPIICYQRNYELYNYGTFFRGYVDFAYDGLPSDINGTDVNVIQGVMIESGMTVVFKKMTDDKRQLFTINRLDSGINILQPIYNGQNEEELAMTVLGDYVRIQKGTYAGKTIHFDGENWIYSQTKTKLNQEPLYNIYDSDGIYVGSQTQYPANDFNGGVIFDYYITDDESVPVDQYTGKRIVCDMYNNYDFVNTIADLKYEYVDIYGVSQTIQGYMYVKNILSGAFNNSWLYKEDTSYQRVATKISLDMDDISEGQFTYQIPFKTYNGLIVKKNGRQLDESSYIIIDNGFTILSAKQGDEIDITMYADDFDILPAGYAFVLPTSFTSNQFNENVVKFSSKDVLEHLTSILQNQIGFEGNANGSNNSYALDVDGSRGKYIVQSDNPILLPMLLENNPSTSVLSAINYASTQYRIVMEKVYNLSIRMLQKNDLSEADYSTYLENLSLLDETISKIFKQINLGKNDQSPFYNNGVAVLLGELYIPATPAFLGLQKPVKPALISDIEGKEWVVCHDGAMVRANHSVADLIRLELENIIYETIYSDFKTSNPTFKSVELTAGYYRKTEYTREQINSIYAHYFVNWAVRNGKNYSENLNGVNSDWKNWNWSSSQMSDGTMLVGSYRAIYKYFFDTVDPSQTPWEMFGFSEKPSWWETAYGEAPYTSANTILWDDAEKGYIRGEDRYDLDYARPTIKQFIPVDTQGNLISPSECGIATSDPSAVARCANWNIGDISDIEYEYMQTSEYRFALESIDYILRPVEWIGENWNTQSTEIKYEGTIYQQTIDKNTQKRPSLRDQVIHNTIVDGTRVRVIGIQQWVVDLLMRENKSLDSYLVDRISNLEMKLSYCAGAFYEKGSVVVLNDASEIPVDNMKLKLIESRTGDAYSYSAVKIVKLNKGYVVTGFDTLTPSFKAMLPIKDNKKTSIEYNGYTFSSYLNYDVTKIVEYPYGYAFNTPNEVMDFLRGYQHYLIDILGFDFVSLNNSGQQIDFNLSLDTFAQWVVTPYDIEDGSYPMIILNPGAVGISLTHEGIIRDTTILTNGEPNIVDLYNRKIASENLSISRDSYLTVFSVLNGDIAGSYRAIKSEYEDILIIDCKTVFGDLLYDPIFSIMKENLHISAVKAAQWNGSLYSPGYLNMSDGLIPNLEKNAFDLNYVFDVDDIKCQTEYKNYSKTLVGYTKTKCIQELIRNEKSMFDFYKGMIADKGTLKPIIAMNRSSIVGGTASDINNLMNDFWALKAGDYGQIAGNTSLEFLLDKTIMHSNPQLITYCPIDGADTDDTYVIQTTDKRWLKRNIASVKANQIRKYNGDIIIPPVGYVNLEDVDFCVANMTELDELESEIVNGQTVFVVDTGDGEWNVVKKSGDNHFISMRYPTLLDAYEHVNQKMVYQFTYDSTIYYTDKNEEVIQPTDLVYSDLNLTQTYGSYASIGLYQYSGKVLQYDAETAFKAKLFNTVFRTTTEETQINKDTVFYCYADDRNYTYSNLAFKFGSVISDNYNIKQYKVTVTVNSNVKGIIVEINGTIYNLGNSKDVVVWVNKGTVVKWRVYAPHCEEIASEYLAEDSGVHITANLRYKKNEYVYNSVGEEREANKFENGKLVIGVPGLYEVVMNGAGGGAGGGATYYKPLSKYDSNSSTNIVANKVYDVANSSVGNVAYLGTVVSDTNINDTRSAGQGGGAGGYIRCILYAEDSGIADIVVGKGGQGGEKGKTVGVTGTNGSATRFKFHNADGTYQYIELIAGGGAAGMGALTNQVSTGSTNELGNYVGTGDGGIVNKIGNSETYTKTVFQSYLQGLSSLRVSGAGAAPTQNPDGFSYTTPLYNECGFGGRPQYMEDGENGDNGRLQVKYLSPLPTETSYVPYTEEVDTYVKELNVRKGTNDYSRVYSIFVVNNWSSLIENPVEFVNGLQDKHYSYGDCVSYNGKKYFCMKNHLASYSFETEAAGVWKEYTNYKNDYQLTELPFYVNGVIGVDARNPYATQIVDSSVLYKSRVSAIQGQLDPNIKLKEYSASKEYVAGDFMTYMGKQYICINQNVNNVPSVGSHYWRPVTVVEKQPSEWNGADEYLVNDIVLYRGQYYQAMLDNTDQVPDVFWYEYPQTFYIKMIIDQWNMDNFEQDEIQPYFPMYYDAECTQPVIDDDENFLDYESFSDTLLDLGIVGLADEIGAYGEVKLSYITEPSWSAIQASGNYIVSSGLMSYFANNNSDNLESEKETGEDYLYTDENIDQSKIAVQYNNIPMLYADITDTLTGVKADGYELTNGDESIYVKAPSGMLTKDTPVYDDENLEEEIGVYSSYLPVWSVVTVSPNEYQMILEYPYGNTVYQKNADETFTAVDGTVYMSLDGEEFTEFTPQDSSMDITVLSGETFYLDKSGNPFTQDLYLFNGENYVKINSMVNDVTVTYKSINYYNMSLYTKDGDTYNKLYNDIFVIKNGEYVSFFDKYFVDVIARYNKIKYNSNPQIRNLFDLYILVDGAYNKLSGDLYSPTKKMTSAFFFDETVKGDAITAIDRNGKEKTIIGTNCYYNNQCKGIKLSMSKLLTTRDEVEKIVLHRNHNDDPVYVKGYEFYMDAINAGLSPTSQPEEFRAYVEALAIPFCKQQEELGYYVNFDDLMTVAMTGSDTNAGVDVIRHAKVYHYYYGLEGTRKYLKLYQFNGIYYMLLSETTITWDKKAVELGTERDLVSFNKIEESDVEESEIVNSIVYKNDGDILYVDFDEVYNINTDEHPDVLTDIYNVGQKYTSKNGSGEKGWIKVEVLGQDYQFNLAGIEEFQPDNTIVDSAYFVNNQTDETIAKMSVIDPMQGMFAMDLQGEVRFISSIDPIGSYSTVQNIYKAKIGDLWWDISKVKYVNYKQSHTRSWWNSRTYKSTDSEFKASNWLKQLNGSEIVINEWTKSKTLPENVTNYITNIELDDRTKLFKKVYYYWKKNPVVMPEGTTRHYTAQYIADKLNLRVEDGAMIFAYADYTATSSSFIISNYAAAVNGVDAVVQINFDLNKSSDSHSDWDMVREKTTDAVPEKLWNQLRESLIGERETEMGTLVLPDPTLPTSMKYGIQIRPRQSMIVDNYEALRNLVDIMNGITLNRTLTTAVDVDSDLLDNIDEPDKAYYDVRLEVEQYSNLRTITDENLIGHCIFVKYDENYDNIWTIYRMRGIGDFVLTDWQEYNISKFYELADLYSSDSIAKMGIIATVYSINDMYELAANDGDIVKLITDGKWILYMKKGKIWEMVAKQDALLKFTDALYSYKDYENDETVFIDLSNSPYWLPNHEYSHGFVVKTIEDETMHYYRCVLTHTSEESFDVSEKQKWVELFNETVYDYKKNEASICLTKILEYFAEG